MRVFATFDGNEKSISDFNHKLRSPFLDYQLLNRAEYFLRKWSTLIFLYCKQNLRRLFCAVTGFCCGRALVWVPTQVSCARAAAAK